MSGHWKLCPYREVRLYYQWTRTSASRAPLAAAAVGPFMSLLYSMLDKWSANRQTIPPNLSINKDSFSVHLRLFANCRNLNKDIPERATGRFANVPFANHFRRFATKRNESCIYNYIYLHMIQKKPWYKKVRYACIYLVLSATDRAKTVGEVTQHVRETTSEVCSEQEVGETTLRWNDRKPRKGQMERRILPWYKLP